MLKLEELEKRFNHHPPMNEAVGMAHSMVRGILKSATAAVLEEISDCREASTFVTKMEEAMFWANAAIARNQ